MTARSRRVRLAVLPVAALVLILTGCVRRTVTITTDPQGAAVTLNDQDVGTSPVSVDFTWYGNYDLIVRRDGYETLHTHHPLKAPWYQIPPIDLFAEAFIPFTVHDRQAMHFTLEPEKKVDRDKLLDEAVEFRERALFGQD